MARKKRGTKKPEIDPSELDEFVDEEDIDEEEEKKILPPDEALKHIKEKRDMSVSEWLIPFEEEILRGGFRVHIKRERGKGPVGSCGKVDHLIDEQWMANKLGPGVYSLQIQGPRISKKTGAATGGNQIYGNKFGVEIAGDLAEQTAENKDDDSSMMLQFLMQKMDSLESQNRELLMKQAEPKGPSPEQQAMFELLKLNADKSDRASESTQQMLFKAMEAFGNKDTTAPLVQHSANLQADYGARVAEMNSAHRSEIDRLDKRYAEDRRSLLEQHDRALRDTREQNNLYIQNLKDDHDKERRAYEKQIVQLRQEISDHKARELQLSSDAQQAQMSAVQAQISAIGQQKDTLGSFVEHAQKTEEMKALLGVAAAAGEPDTISKLLAAANNPMVQEAGAKLLGGIGSLIASRSSPQQIPMGPWQQAQTQQAQPQVQPFMPPLPEHRESPRQTAPIVPSVLDEPEPEMLEPEAEPVVEERKPPQLTREHVEVLKMLPSMIEGAMDEGKPPNMFVAELKELIESTPALKEQSEVIFGLVDQYSASEITQIIEKAKDGILSFGMRQYLREVHRLLKER